MPTQLKGNQSADEGEDLAEDQLALRRTYLALTLDGEPLNHLLFLNFISSPCLSQQQHVTVLACIFKAAVLLQAEYEQHWQWHSVPELLEWTVGRRTSVDNTLPTIKHCLCRGLLFKTQKLHWGRLLYSSLFQCTGTCAADAQWAWSKHWEV